MTKFTKRKFTIMKYFPYKNTYIKTRWNVQQKIDLDLKCTQHISGYHAT